MPSNDFLSERRREALVTGPCVRTGSKILTAL